MRFNNLNRIKYLTFIVGIAVSSFLFAQKISIMSFNIENGGTQVDFNQVVHAIKESKADVVGVQEAWGNIPRLAKALGWKYYNIRQHIISHYPLFESSLSHNKVTLIEVSPKQFVAMSNVHLPDEPYGPDLVKKGVAQEKILDNEIKTRLPTAKAFIKPLMAYMQLGTPVFLTGDFNSPSHLDSPTPWSVTRFLKTHHLVDSYRFMHANVKEAPGYSWPAKRPMVKNSMDNFNPSKEDEPTRLDFIFTGGNSKVLASQIYCKAKPWPSDHCAVLSQFEVKPVTMDISHFIALPDTEKTTQKASLSVSQSVIREGKPFTIRWRHAPGHRYDYIRISPIHSKALGWGEAVRLYLKGNKNGQIQYNAKNSKGNWLAWHKGQEGTWPMPPGLYDIKLMLDDGYTELAATKVRVE